MLQILHTGHSEFRSGWFIESLATQSLVVFVIRTRRVPFTRSRPSLPMLITPPLCAVIGAVLPFSPLARVLGFTALPLRFFLILLGMIGTYLVLVELAKSRFYATHPHHSRPPTTHEERTLRSIRRRGARFIHHIGPHASRGGHDVPLATTIATPNAVPSRSSPSSRRDG